MKHLNDMMNRLVLIPAEFLTAAGAAAGNVGAKMSPPPPK